VKCIFFSSGWNEKKANRAPEIRGHLGARVRRSADRMARMISDLLDFTRIEAFGGLPVERAWIDLREVLTEALDEVELVHPGRLVAA
jgi:signal transduction histidine kinase